MPATLPSLWDKDRQESHAPRDSVPEPTDSAPANVQGSVPRGSVPGTTGAAPANEQKSVSRGSVHGTIESDAKEYKDNFERHAQFVFSRVQHHWHHEQDGVRVPTAYCRKPGLKIRNQC